MEQISECRRRVTQPILKPMCLDRQPLNHSIMSFSVECMRTLGSDMGKVLRTAESLKCRLRRSHDVIRISSERVIARGDKKYAPRHHTFHQVVHIESRREPRNYL